jgi:hypothetical protein
VHRGAYDRAFQADEQRPQKLAAESAQGDGGPYVDEETA